MFEKITVKQVVSYLIKIAVLGVIVKAFWFCGLIFMLFVPIIGIFLLIPVIFAIYLIANINPFEFKEYNFFTDYWLNPILVVLGTALVAGLLAY